MVVCRIHNTCHRVPIDLMFHLYVLVMIQLILTLKMTTAQVVETSVTVNNNSPIHDYFHPDDSTYVIMRSTFYQNLLIGQETSVCFPHEWVSLLSRLNLEKIYRPFPATNKTVHKSGCP